MLFAKVVVGLAVSGPFDYAVPKDLSNKIKVGSRVWVSFGSRRIVGYVVGLNSKTSIKKLKPILELIDEIPVLNKGLMWLTQELSEYYCSFWGGAIETTLPEVLRKGKNIQLLQGQMPFTNPEISVRQRAFFILVQDSDGRARWDIYIAKIKEAISGGKSVIMLLPDHESLEEAKKKFQAYNLPVGVLYRGQPDESQVWLKVKEGKFNIVLATRSGIFAPLDNLGLIIVDDEANTVYKQEQTPHYHAREVAFMRAKNEGAGLILGSASASLESLYKVKKGKMQYLDLSVKGQQAQVNIIDTRRMPFAQRKNKVIFSQGVQDAIEASLSAGEKNLLFLNRKGFATCAYCHTCGVSLRCPRCNINLVFHFDQDLLSCHYCNFSMKPPQICPECNSGYIKYSGSGTEKIESEISRIFPQARVKRLDGKPFNQDEADIFVSTSAVLKQKNVSFGLTAVLGIDNSLNHVDFRSSERTFSLLLGLLGITKKNLCIQSNISGHHIFKALREKNPGLFYDQELKERKQLKLPPWRHLILVKLRSKKDEVAKTCAEKLFKELNENNKDKATKILSLNASIPAKLRGNFYWQILLSCVNVKKAGIFIKNTLKDFRHSGIIVTVDVDPV